MAVPKKRKSKSKKFSRQAASDKRTMGQLSLCTQCGIEKLPHRICPSCGFYKDSVVVAGKIKTDKTS